MTRRRNMALEARAAATGRRRTRELGRQDALAGRAPQWPDGPVYMQGYRQGEREREGEA
jgi:hypothetical protein